MPPYAIDPIIEKINAVLVLIKIPAIIIAEIRNIIPDGVELPLFIKILTAIQNRVITNKYAEHPKNLCLDSEYSPKK